MPTELDSEDARQAKANLGVRYMLAGGILLVVIAFLLIWFFG